MDGHGDSILNPEQLFQILVSQTLQTETRRFWVAYSGGVDSRVLLDLCFQAFKNKPDYHLGAVHVHHGLSENADAWANHCENVCSQMKIPFNVLWVDANVYDDGSPEEVAREARFQAFEQFLQEKECLLLAHHAEDQAETILLRLFRGAGPLGLGGMPNAAPLGKGQLLRPLLSVSKEAVLAYASLANLNWIEDESNQNCRFDRNFLRQTIFPHLKARWPRVVRSVSRAGALCLETATAVQVLAANDYESVRIPAKEDPSKFTLSVSTLLKLAPVRRRAVIRYWLQENKYALPSLDHMERIDREVLQAAPDKHPRLKISDYELSREKGELRVLSLL